MRQAFLTRAINKVRRLVLYRGTNWAKRAAFSGVGSVNFFPDKPHEGYVVSKVLSLVGARILSGKRPRAGMINVYWLDTTMRDPLQGSALEEFAILNGHCTDISKETLNRVHADVFGYTPGVDPEKYSGEMVVKSTFNARHDGRIVRGPLPAVQKDQVCQMLLDNQCDNGNVMDIRVPIVNKTVPFIYLKYRPASDRFSIFNSYVTLEAAELLSGEERGKLLALATAIGMDYGELDVIRDKQDGRIYVVDANNTPAGPPNGLDPLAGANALCMLEAEFLKMIRQFNATLPANKAVAQVV